ncbi:MAG: hypothetical protein LUF90_03095 [Rikenellaceae bacterium]|nr:hypothetical protein [Rikenellaceae bacterium]
MKNVKNGLVVVGIIALVLLISLVVVEIRAAWSIIVWVLGSLIVIFVIGYIVYLVRKLKNKNDRIDE